MKEKDLQTTKSISYVMKKVLIKECIISHYI